MSARTKLSPPPLIARTGNPIPVARALLPKAAHVIPYLVQIDQSRRYANFGPLTLDLEERFAARFSAPAHVATMANGTVALTLALKALGAEPGALCLMPSWTFVATAHAACQAGLVPYFVDVDADSWMLDPAAIPNLVAAAPGRVGAIVPVAAFGRMPDVSAWVAVREALDIPVLLDAAAAFDALTDARVPATVSLHATKTLGVGEGGFIVSQDKAMVDRARALSSFGFCGSRDSQFVASNAKLNEYAAAVGHAGLDAWPAARLRFALAGTRLRIALARLRQISFQPGWSTEWVSSVCVVGLPAGASREVEASLSAFGVETRRWWGDGCHASPAFADCPRSALPNTEALAASTIGLPFSCDLSDDEIADIAEALTRALGA